MKKTDLPYMPFYVGDWRKCPEVRALSLAARALWFEMLCLMWESNRRGYLELGGEPISIETLGRMVGEHTEIVSNLLSEMEKNNVFSREKKTGIILNRRMVSDEELRLSRSKAGTKGMKSRYNKNHNEQDNKQDNKAVTGRDIEIDNGISFIPGVLDSNIPDSNIIDSGKEKPVDPESRRLCLLLRDRILENRQQKITDAILEEWQKTVDKMVRLDKRTHAQIEDLINECHDMEPGPTGFTWRNNILSMGKLRERWNEGKIFIGMNHANKPKNQKPKTIWEM